MGCHGVLICPHMDHEKRLTGVHRRSGKSQKHVGTSTNNSSEFLNLICPHMDHFVTIEAWMKLNRLYIVCEYEIHTFFYKNIVYKNHKTQIVQNLRKK